MYRSSDDINLI
jgi:protein-tyrosine phosphatase